jgi:hypothetical protein
LNRDSNWHVLIEIVCDMENSAAEMTNRAADYWNKKLPTTHKNSLRRNLK